VDSNIYHFPLVSICIPTYNAAAYLEPCLQSALAQTYLKTEILICDDASTDETIAIIKKYQQQNAKIRLIQNVENIGMVNNWNNCIKQAKGSWIKFLFMDDILQPDCIKKMLNACEQNKAEVAVCARGFILVDDALPHFKSYFNSTIVKPEHVFGTNTVFIAPEKLTSAVKKYFLQNILGEPTCFLFHKNLSEKIPLFDPSLRQLVDYEFILRLGLSKGFVFIPEVLACFRVHGTSQSSSNGTKNKKNKLRHVTSNIDQFVLLHKFLYNPTFNLIRNAISETVLNNYIKHIYYSGCKHNGQKIFDTALLPIKATFNFEELNLKNSFFNYIRYRFLVKRWEKAKNNSVF
jgi:glycosyltransferase involved in cell wall biosynthesis